MHAILSTRKLCVLKKEHREVWSVKGVACTSDIRPLDWAGAFLMRKSDNIGVSESEGRMLPQDEQTLLAVAQWIATHRNKRQTMRELAGTEEHYLHVVRELDRVEQQCFRARTLHTEATLTLVEWLETLHYFHWQCAYCQAKPFQILSHYLPLARAGTTADNCVPACRRCGLAHKQENERVRSYLAHIKARRESSMRNAANLTAEACL